MVHYGDSKKNKYCSIMFAVVEEKENEEKMSNCWLGILTFFNYLTLGLPQGGN